MLGIYVMLYKGTETSQMSSRTFTLLRQRYLPAIDQPITAQRFHSAVQLFAGYGCLTLGRWPFPSK